MKHLEAKIIIILAVFLLVLSGCDIVDKSKNKDKNDNVTVATLTTPDGTQSEDVEIEYILTDPDENPSNIIIQY